MHKWGMDSKSAETHSATYRCEVVLQGFHRLRLDFSGVAAAANLPLVNNKIQTHMSY